jgi:hypothetical protein
MGEEVGSLSQTGPNIALKPTASSFGAATLRLRFRRRLTAGVMLQMPTLEERNA